jgi:hypothetical protein
MKTHMNFIIFSSQQKKNEKKFREEGKKALSILTFMQIIVWFGSEYWFVENENG